MEKVQYFIGICIIIYAFFLFLTLLAKKGLFFTTIRQNEYLIVEVGGVFKKVISRIVRNGVSFRVNKQGDVIEGKGGVKSILPKFLGITWIGLAGISSIKKYHLIRNKFIAGDQVEIVFKDEWVDSILDKTTYTFTFNNIEVEGNIDTRYRIQVTTQTTNVIRTVYGVLPSGNWVNKMGSMLYEVVKQHGGNGTFEQIRAEKEKKPIAGAPSTATLSELVFGTNDELKELCGQEIVSFDFLEFDEEGSEEVKKALQAKEVARLNAESVVEAAKGKAEETTLLAKANAEKIRVTGEAEKDRIAAVYSAATAAAGNISGKEMFISEQVRDSKLLSLDSKILFTRSVDEK